MMRGRGGNIWKEQAEDRGRGDNKIMKKKTEGQERSREGKGQKKRGKRGRQKRSKKNRGTYEMEIMKMTEGGAHKWRREGAGHERR